MATTATMSGLQFDALPYEEGRRWELLEGELIEVSGATLRHQLIVSRILRALEDYLKGNAPAGLVVPDLEFALSAETRLRPDVCILLPPKAATLDWDLTPVPGAPDLAIEIISPTERASESHSKVLACLRNGVSEVWQVFPKDRSIQFHKSEIAISLNAGQQVTSDLLPGFSAPVASFFE